MSKKFILSSISLIVLVGSIFAFSYIKKERVKLHNNNTDYSIHLDLAVDPSDMNAYVGLVDYVFIGKVDKYIGNFDEDSDYIPTSKYNVTVLENLKGNLQLNTSIEVAKHGGYNSDGKLILFDGYEIKDFLPEEGKEYIFMAYGQPNGTVLLAELNGNVEYNNDDSILEKYRNYVSEQIEFDRERYASIYEK